MATRLYPAIKTPGDYVHQSPRGNWGSVGGAVSAPWASTTYLWELSTIKTDCGARNAIVDTYINHLHDATTGTFLYNWVTPPMNGAGTISGTFQLCLFVMTRWHTASTQTVDAHLRYMVTISLASKNGTHKAYLAQDVIDSVDLQRNIAQTFIWQSLAAPISLASVAWADGDRIRIEIGYHVQSVPAFAPVTYPPSEGARLSLGYTGVTSGDADATAGSQNGSLTAWFEFSQDYTFQTPVAPGVGTTCATAVVLGPTLPASAGPYNTTACPGTDREFFFQWTAPAVLEGTKVVLACHGSNYRIDVQALTGACGSQVTYSTVKGTGVAPGRSQSVGIIQPVAGTTYTFRCRNLALSVNAANSGGSLRVSLTWVKPPQNGDIIVGAGSIVSYRDGVLNNIYPAFGVTTGMGFDLTKRTMTDINGGTNSNERLLIAEHSDFVEIMDTLDIFNEVDFIPRAHLGLSSLQRAKCASMSVRSDGMMFLGMFGNGYQFVEGMTLDDSAYFNAVSDTADASDLRKIDATFGDSQPGAPFTAAQYTLPLEKFAPWAIAIDHGSGIIYYTTGAIYSWMDWSTNPNAAGSAFAAKKVMRYNLNTNTPLTPFTVQVTDPWVGVRGLALMSLGRLLVANATEVTLISTSTGNIMKRFFTNDPIDGWDIVAVESSPDESKIYGLDETSSKLFVWDYVTEQLIQTIDTGLFVGSTTQLAVYKHQCECCVATQIQIMNDALFAIGVSKTITTLGEATREAVTCENFYQKAIEETLRAHPWSFATKYARSVDNLVGYMDLIDGSVADPINEDWTFGYRYPIDCITARRIVPPGEKRKYNRAPIVFRVGRQWVGTDGVTPLPSDDDTRLIFTDQPDATLEYTALVTCAENFSDPLFKAAVRWKLASKIAPSLSRVAKMSALCENMFRSTVSEAEKVDMQEQQQEKSGEADWIADRN